VSGLRFDAVLILGKELRRDPERALRELRARSAGAAVALRRGVPEAWTLEAPLRGQPVAGSDIVVGLLAELGVAPGVVVAERQTRSTREEALGARRLVGARGVGRLLVVTSAYHVPRARRVFEDVLGAAAVAVHAPEALLQGATAQERDWIREGHPRPADLAHECRVEALWSGLERLIAPLPASVRWSAEVRAGALLRGLDEQRGAGAR
jgi:uncharacterized SAM-binding protein YcdF (DUF218 family)